MKDFKTQNIKALITNIGQIKTDSRHRSFAYKIFSLSRNSLLELISHFQDLDDYCFFGPRDSFNFIMGSGFYTTANEKLISWAGDLPWLTMRNFEDNKNTFYLPAVSIYRKSGEYRACILSAENMDYNDKIPIEWSNRDNQFENTEYLKIYDLINQLSTKDEKIVYSVEQRQKFDTPFHIDLVKLIDEKWQHSYKILIKNSDQTYFCPSPERIIKRDKNYSYTESLAGTETSDQKKHLENERIIQENHIVLKYLLGKIKREGFEPEVFKHNISHGDLKHIKYNIKFKRCNFLKSLKLLNELYPTPAICGVPQKWAYEKIKSVESPRGIYSGYFGGGVGKFFDIAVCLRGSLQRQDNLFYRAGAGLTQASFPNEEINEINQKLKNCARFFNNIAIPDEEAISI